MTVHQMCLVETAILLVCQKYHVTPADLESKSRSAPLVWPRHVAMTLCRHGARLGVRQTGVLFHRTPSGITRAVQAARDWASSDPKKRDELTRLSAEFASRIENDRAEARRDKKGL